MVYRTMQGKEIDLEKLMKQHELMPAIGNMKVNARGDELGPGGTIVRKREEIVADYYDTNPNAVPKARPVKEFTQPTQTVAEEPKNQHTFNKKYKTEE